MFRPMILHSFFVSIIKHINMKSLIVILSCLSIFFLTAGFTKNAGAKSGDEKIEVYFSNKLDFNDLVKLRLELAEKKINVNYQMLEFNAQGQLASIKFNVTSDGKYCGSGGSSVLDKEYGFSIDRSPNAQFYFQVGLRK